MANDSFFVNDVNNILVLFSFDLSDATIFLPNNRGPNVLVNVMPTNEQIKIEKLKPVSIGISTATIKFKILLLDANLPLDCRCNNVCYFHLLH